MGDINAEREPLIKSNTSSGWRQTCQPPAYSSGRFEVDSDYYYHDVRKKRIVETLPPEKFTEFTDATNAINALMA